MIGQCLGQYRLTAKIGEGGMGVVYEAEDTHLGRHVAIKVLAPKAVSDPDRRRRFVQEARMASALNHPNILHVYDINQADGIDYIAMEYVPGKTLDQLISPTGMPLPEALRYAVQIAAALARAHAAGIVHRDVKPSNVIVTDEGLVKVLDFGLAKLTEEHAVTPSSATETLYAAGSPQTEVGVIVGTIAYMSPEQAEGKTVDRRSDIFSFGSLLYQMITGQCPFQGESKLATLSAVLSKEPKPFSEVRKEPAPREIESIVRRCLRKDPDGRFQHMSEVKAALENLQGTTKTASPHARRKWLAACSALVAGLTLIVAFSPGLRKQAAELFRLGRDRESKLVVVLPFECAAGDPTAQALCEGLGETLGRRLQSLNPFQRHLRILRAAEYRPKPVSAGEARKNMGASLALAGKLLQQNGGNIRMRVSLIDATNAADLRHLDIEAATSDVSRADVMVEKVAKIAGLDRPPETERTLAKGSTTVPGTYNLYLQAFGYLTHADQRDDLDRAITLFQKAIEQDHSYGLALLGLGEAFWAKSTLTKDKHWAELARETCLQASNVDVDTADLHILLGRIYQGTGQPQSAVEEFQRALQIDRLRIQAYSGLGAAYEKLGRLIDAEATYQSLIRLWPNYHDAYTYLVSFDVRQGRAKEAEPLARKVIELVPENSLGYQNLGAVYYFLGRSTDADAAMKRALAIQPTAKGYSNLGASYFFEGRYSDAVPLMEKAVEMDRGNYLFWGNLGDAYRWSPESKLRAPEAYRQAIKLAQQQLALDPTTATIRSQLAQYFAKLPDSRQALTEIAHARRLAPNDPSVLQKSATVYEIAGLRDQALSALDLALQSGYSMDEVRRDPEFAELRKDARFQKLERKVAGSRPQP